MVNKSIVFLLTFYLTSINGYSPVKNITRPNWPGYEYYPDIHGWLKLFSEPADWQTARMNCHDEDAILAAPMNNQFYSILMKMMSTYYQNTFPSDPERSAFYVAIQMNYPEGVYKQTGSHKSKIALSQDADAVMKMETCGAYYGPNLSWVDCNFRLPYFCHAPASSKCGDNSLGYEVDDRTGQCYKFHSQAKPWNTAHGICLDEGAHLAIPNSEVEAQVLVDLFAKYPYEKLNGTNPAWGVMAVGFYYWKEADKYVTIFGETITQAGYDRWSGGNPSSRGKSKELGGGMFRSGLLDDVDKSYKVPFICEKKPIRPQSFCLE